MHVILSKEGVSLRVAKSTEDEKEKRTYKDESHSKDGKELEMPKCQNLCAQISSDIGIPLFWQIDRR